MTTLRRLKILLLSICLVGLPIGAFWLGWRVLDGGNRAKEARSQGRFAQIELMLHIYHEEHGAFPPTKYQPKPGGPIHSWRVLLVPYTSALFKEKYSQYDISKEWNSTTNLKALSRMPYFSYFRMHGEGDNDITHYLAIGEGDEWPSKNPLRSRLITKGKDRFLVVEDPDSTIHWMEPKY